MQNPMSLDQFKADHFKSRIAEVVAEYEDKMAVGSIQLQYLAQERDQLTAQNAELTAEIDRLTERLSEYENTNEENNVA